MAESKATAPEAPAQPLAAGAADAMIAQAVGEQIDQMLATADVERPAAVGESGAAQPTSDANSVIFGELNRLIDRENQSTSAAPDVQGSEEKAIELENAPAALKADAAVPASVESEPASSDGPTPPFAAAAAAPLDATCAEPPPQPSPGVPGEGVNSAPSAEASRGASLEEEAQELDGSPESHQASLPAWLKPLEILNQPFLFIPDSVRSALGKAAIVTIVNSMALLIYVFKFRNHH